MNAIIRHGGLPGTQAYWIQQGHDVCNDLANDAAMGMSSAKAGAREVQIRTGADHVQEGL